MKVHWTDRAKARLRLIHDHIAQDAPLVATQVVERLIARSRQIGEFPYAGREVPEYQRDDLHEVLERPYRIIYRIGSQRIDVITVMHYRQLLPSDLAKLK
ncbi:MAG: type II toxin-antitoxin system RelE/ParE family toxin [Gammaproteobacteria bacterium]|nr:MAG: type II toxin-antitoxin system RelE/ParE family toxin [Gammaproteobacteria bacterium]